MFNDDQEAAGLITEGVMVLPGSIASLMGPSDLGRELSI